MNINFNFMSMFFTLINIALYVLIAFLIINGIKKAKNFIHKINNMDKKIDKILEKLDDTEKH